MDYGTALEVWSGVEGSQQASLRLDLIRATITTTRPTVCSGNWHRPISASRWRPHAPVRTARSSTRATCSAGTCSRQVRTTIGEACLVTTGRQSVTLRVSSYCFWDCRRDDRIRSPAIPAGANCRSACRQRTAIRRWMDVGSTMTVGAHDATEY